MYGASKHFTELHGTSLTGNGNIPPPQMNDEVISTGAPLWCLLVFRSSWSGFIAQFFGHLFATGTHGYQ
jgi:hypothetical protein